MSRTLCRKPRGIDALLNRDGWVVYGAKTGGRNSKVEG